MSLVVGLVVSLHSVLYLLRTYLNSTRIEALLVVGAVAVAFAFPGVGSNWFRKVEQGGSKLARRRRLAVLIVGMLALAARAAVLPIRPIPHPVICDEFSYLLAADTFAHGRLTNPTHPMWMHFQTFHVLQKPTYMSKYYPAQGLILAAGQVVAGHPFWGVWLSMGLMCAVLCWMLQGWMPPGWALLGGVLSLIRLAPFSYWGNSYFGGAAAATGGALVIGALPRLRRSPRVRNSLLLGLGLAILANSRPYEGFFLVLAVALMGAVWLLGRKRPTLGVILRRVVAPVLMVLVLTICAMGYYFWRVTGSPFRTPYLVYAETYDPVPVFPWQSMKAVPNYHQQEMMEIDLQWEFGAYQFAREHPGKLAWEKVRDLVGFFLGPLLMMPVLVLLLATGWSFWWGLTRSRKARLLAFISSIFLVGMALPKFFNPHYAAPLTGALYALAMLAMRHLRLWQWRGRRVGLQIVRAVPVLAVAMLVLHTSFLVLHQGPFIPSQNSGRTSILTELKGYSGGQLVIVKYNLDNDPSENWVYNGADIDAAKVVWAWDMGASANEELIRYFKDRRVWLLDVDESPPKLLPYIPMEGNRAAAANAKP
jgi:hypothetical protein